MVAKIRLEAEDATAPAFSSAAQNASKAQQALDGVSGSMQQVGDASGNLSGQMAEADAQLEDVQATIDRLQGDLISLAEAEEKAAAAAEHNARSLDRTGDEAAQSAEQVRRLDAALEKTGSSGGSFVESMAKLWALKETFTKLAQGANYLAEQGNPAFVSLRESGMKLFEALMKITELEEVQTFINTLAGAFEGTAQFISDNVESVNWLVRKYKDLVEVVTSYLEAMGLVAEGTTEELQRMKALEAEESKRYEEKLAKQKLDIQAAKQKEEADKALAEFEKQRAVAKEAEDAKRVSSAEELAKMQEAEIERMKTLASEGKLTADQTQDSQRRLQMWEQRKAEVEKESIDKVSREKEEAAKKTEDLAKKETDAQKKAAENVAEEAKKANDEKLKDFEDHVKKLMDAVDSTKQQDGSGIDQNLRNAVSGDNLMKGVVEKRQQKAEDDLKWQYAERGEDASGKDFEKERRKLMKQVERETVRQARTEGIDPEELGAVQQDMANKIIDQGEKSGTLGKTSAAALREQAKALASQNTELEQINRQMEEVQKFMEGVNSRNERRTAQRRVS